MSAQIASLPSQNVRLFSWALAKLPIDWRRWMGRRGLLFVLIHGTWCYACVDQLVSLRRKYAWLKDLGVEVLVASSDDPSQVAAFNSSLASPLPYSLVSDEGATLSRALGLYDEKARTAHPAMMLVDCTGIVHFALIDQHGIPEQAVLLQAITQLPKAC
jgi:peroxiredoxin